MPGQVMPGQTMQGQTVADQAVPGQTMPMPGQIPVVNQTMPSQIMSGVTMPSQTMAGMTMAGQTTTGHDAVDGANNQWQQGMFMPPGMMPMPQLPPPPPGMYPPMIPWTQYYEMPYMMPHTCWSICSEHEPGLSRTGNRQNQELPVQSPSYL